MDWWRVMANYLKGIPLIDSDDFVKSHQLAAETPTGYAPAIDRIVKLHSLNNLAARVIGSF